jgi:uncharacterized protein (DUF1697 family)
MGTFLAMLRSINVGGRNRIPMADLRALVAALGFSEVTTYVQSGNVVFGGTGSPKNVAGAIEKGIAAELGLAVPVVVRSKRQFHAIVDGTPFADLDVDPKLLHVTFLGEIPGPEAVTQLAGLAGQFGDDRCEVAGENAYLYCPGGYGETKLSNAYLERRLGVTATTRNWRTVTTLAEMAGITVEHRPDEAG